MPAILPALVSAARHLVLALAGLGLVATTMSALPARAATGDRSADELTTSPRPAAAARVNTGSCRPRPPPCASAATPTPTAPAGPGRVRLLRPDLLRLPPGRLPGPAYVRCPGRLHPPHRQVEHARRRPDVLLRQRRGLPRGRSSSAGHTATPRWCTRPAPASASASPYRGRRAGSAARSVARSTLWRAFPVRGGRALTLVAVCPRSIGVPVASPPSSRRRPELAVAGLSRDRAPARRVWRGLRRASDG